MRGHSIIRDSEGKDLLDDRFQLPDDYKERFTVLRGMLVTLGQGNLLSDVVVDQITMNSWPMCASIVASWALAPATLRGIGD